MSGALYTPAILRLATALGDQPRLAAPDATIERRTPVCGSRVTIDLVIDDGVVRAFGQEVRACALGQASAALLGTSIIGADVLRLAEARDALGGWLSGARDDPGAWPGLDILAGARGYPARHAAILLPFAAAAEAAAR